MRLAVGGEAAGTGSRSIERAEAALRALSAGLAEVIDEFQDAPTKPRDEDRDGDADIDHCGPHPEGVTYNRY
jgi:hypothetical protein